MPGETIGNSRCQCIIPFNKRYLIKAIEEAIDRQEKEIKRTLERAEEIRKNELLTPEELISIRENTKRDLQMVWKRTNNTPECK